MNKMLVNTAEHSVDWLRGSREHVLATDLLDVAPILPQSQKLHFFFQAPTMSRGRWLPSDESQELGRHNEIVASLRITEPNRMRKWSFVVDNLSPITKRITDFAEASIISSVSVEDRCAKVAMTDEFSVWEYLIWSTKGLGLVVHPGVSWYIVYVTADVGRFPHDMAGCTMTVQSHRKRIGIYELKFSLDGTILGTVGAHQRDQQTTR